MEPYNDKELYSAKGNIVNKCIHITCQGTQVSETLLIKTGEINWSINMVRDLKTPLTLMHRLRQKLSKEAADLTQAIEQMELIGIYTPFHFTDIEYTVFPHQYMKLSPSLIMLQATKGASANFKKSKLSHASSQTISIGLL